MKRHSKALVRLLAVLALAAAVVALVVVVSDSLGGGDSKSRNNQIGKHQSDGGGGKKDHKGPPPKSYVVQPGDTLSSIAHKTGVSISRIQRLNPGVDPQILLAGDKLKLR
jgi:LysM repeat protein